MPAISDQEIRRVKAQVERDISTITFDDAYRVSSQQQSDSLNLVDEGLTRSIWVKSEINVSKLFDRQDIKAFLEKRTEAHVDLIVTIPKSFASDINDLVTQAFKSGTRWENVATRLEAMPKSSEWIAERIARDQGNKARWAFERLRMDTLGVEYYYWATVEDERVRQEHLDLAASGLVWGPENIPPEGEPGEPIMCRCWKEWILR
jgi:uncharacterized protein with gpF-like domain